MGVETDLKALLINKRILQAEEAEEVYQEARRILKKVSSSGDGFPPLPTYSSLYTPDSDHLVEEAKKYGFDSSVEVLGESNELDFQKELGEEVYQRTVQERDTVGHFSKYRLLGELGRGGMAKIFEVWDGDLRRHLAMKVLNPKYCRSARARQRFIAEAQAMAQLQHPNIIPVHEIGQTPQNAPYFTMDIVRGHTLDEVTKHLLAGDEDFKKLYPRRRILQIFLKICEGVAYAHSKGVIHRDLKPQNIMVGAFGQVYIMDWGLAKFLKSNPTSGVWTDKQENAWMTQEGAVVGTPSYMAPEQARGEIEKVDERSDVYSLGAILFEMLTWQPPFQASTVEQAYQLVLQGKTPYAEDFNLSPSPIGRELCAIIAKAMSKSRNVRYPAVVALKNDVNRFLNGEAIQAMPETPWKRSWRYLSKNRTFFFLLLIVLAFWALYTWMSREQMELETSFQKARQVADLWKLSLDSSLVSKRWKDLISTLPSSLRPWAWTHRARFYFRRGELKLAAQDLQRALEGDVVEASSVFLLHRIYLYCGNLQRAARVLEDYRSVFSEGWQSYLEAWRHYIQKDYSKAWFYFRRSVSSGVVSPQWGHSLLAFLRLSALSTGASGVDWRSVFEQVEQDLGKAERVSKRRIPLYYVAKALLVSSKARLDSGEKRRKRLFEAIGYITRAMEAVVRNGYFYYLRGRIYQSLQTLEGVRKAREDFQLALRYLYANQELRKKVRSELGNW